MAPNPLAAGTAQIDTLGMADRFLIEFVRYDLSRAPFTLRFATRFG